MVKCRRNQETKKIRTMIKMKTKKKRINWSICQCHRSCLVDGDRCWKPENNDQNKKQVDLIDLNSIWDLFFLYNHHYQHHPYPSFFNIQCSSQHRTKCLWVWCLLSMLIFFVSSCTSDISSSESVSLFLNNVSTTTIVPIESSSNHNNSTTFNLYPISSSTTNYFNLSKESVKYIWNSGNPSIKTSKRSKPVFLTDKQDDPLLTDDLDDSDPNDVDDSSDLMVVEDMPPLVDSEKDLDDYEASKSSVRTKSEEDDEQQNNRNYYLSSSFFNDNVDYVMHSPRTVQTKYGTLQGIVMTFVRYNDEDETKNVKKSFTSFSNSSSPPPIITLAPVEAFLGVPYATPPSGNLRFMPPVAPIHWRGVRQANHLAPVCPQPLPEILINNTMTQNESNSQQQQKTMNISQRHLDRLQRQLPFLRNQSEDCLHLNIYVPFEQYYQHRLFQRQRQQQQQHIHNRKKTFDSSNFDEERNRKNPKDHQKRYPVIVFISGDSYDTGTGNSFDASIWASYGRVIVVTLNYRLGVLGFLPALVDGTIRGNYGLMDQVAALHWIQENIAEFGGEPSNVTVMGHGFGAACVHLLMLSPMAKGLFSRVSLMSGSALAPSAIAREAENYARLLAKELNCPVYDNIQLVDCLKRKPFDELLQVNRLRPSRYLSPFGPIIDGIVVVEEPRVMMESMVYGPLSSSNTNSASTSSSSSSSLSPSTSSSSSIVSSSKNNLLFLNKNSASDLFAATQYNGDILFGVTRVQCPPDVFSSYEERYGITVERRNQVLRTLIRNLFDFHQQTIFWTLINEYTDWSRPSEHPINLLDSTIDILGDALVLAPLIETVELYAKSMTRFTGNARDPYRSSHDSYDFPYHRDDSPTSSGKLFFYVFQNGKSIELDRNDGTTTTTTNTQSVDQRLGSMSDDELDYLFGAPIAQHVTGHSIGHFITNWTNIGQDIHLSEMLITYFSNFAKYGNPNHPSGNNRNSLQKDHHNGDEDNNEFLSSRIFLNWPVYTIGQQRFLLIGSKPRLRDHYQSHRLSYWLNLIPHLLQDHYSSSISLKNNKALNGDSIINEDIMPSLMFVDHHKDDIGLRYIRHHLLDNFDDINSYDGPVRQITFNRHHNHHQQQQQQQNQQNQNNVSGQRKFNSGNWLRSSSGSLFRMNADQSLSLSNNTSNINGLLFGGGFKTKTTSHTALHDQKTDDNTTTATSKRHSSDNNVGTENNLLSATIAVGCSLLALNLLVFAGVYYNLQRRSDVNSNGSPLANESMASSHHHHHLHHHQQQQQQQQQIVYCSSSSRTEPSNNEIQTPSNSNETAFNVLNNNGMIINDYFGAKQPQSHVQHIHYADQIQMEPEISSSSSRTNTLQRGHHHHHVHHRLSVDPSDDDPNVADSDGRITASTTTILNNSQSPIGHHHHQPQYFPLHSFSSSTTTTSNTTNNNNTTETDTDTMQQQIGGGRTTSRIRFSLSPSISYTDQSNVPSIGGGSGGPVSSSGLMVLQNNVQFPAVDQQQVTTTAIKRMKI